MSSRITIGLHTPSHAKRLSALLAKEGIDVTIAETSIDLNGDEVPVSMEVDIENLPTALRIIENIEIFNLDGEASPIQVRPRKTAKDLLLGKKTQSVSNKETIVVPIDFSEYSFMAAQKAFYMAKRLDARITLLHAYVLPSATDNFSLSPDTVAFEPQDMELDITIEETAKQQMNNFTSKLREKIKDGTIPPVKFDVEIQEGLPESVINDFAREKDPLVIVMGTRGANKKERELVGSITAEVLDTTRFSVITIPETVDKAVTLGQLKHVAFFCNLDNDDITALNVLNKLFKDSQFDITFFYITSRKDKFNIINSNESLKKLTNYCRAKYKNYSFSAREIPPKEAKDFFTGEDSKDIDFIVVPNKRRHALARFFNPGLAHRLLFVADIPMLVVPV